LFFVSLNACQKDDISISFDTYFEDHFNDNSGWTFNGGSKISDGRLIVSGDFDQSASAIKSLEKENNRIISGIKIKLKGLNVNTSNSGGANFRFLINNVEATISFYLPEPEFEGEVLIEYFGDTEILKTSLEGSNNYSIDTKVRSDSYENNYIRFGAGGSDPFGSGSISLDYIKVEVAYSNVDVPNYPPFCEIRTKPISDYRVGDIIAFSVRANDGPNIQVSSFKFYLDENLVELPYGLYHSNEYYYYSCFIGTKNLSSGQHLIKVVAIDDIGAQSTDEMEFELKEKVEAEYFIDPRDDQKYRIVTIGSQTWMAENLNYKTEEGSKYYNDDNTYALFGRIYTREAAMNACPDGWHLPSQDEWIKLGMQVGLSEDNIYGIANIDKLKSKHAWVQWFGTTDDYGFTIIPGAYDQSYIGNFERALFWTSTLENMLPVRIEIYSNHSLDWPLLKDSDYPFSSIRCIKD
jgi:uncharacterized protein (TIGR02145 family)